MIFSAVFLVYALVFNLLLVSGKESSAAFASLIFTVVSIGFVISAIVKKQLKTPSGFNPLLGVVLASLQFTGNLIGFNDSGYFQKGLMFIVAAYSIVSSRAWSVKKRSGEAPETLTVKKRSRALLKQSISGAVSYILAAVTAFLYMLFLDEDSGMIIFAIMLVVPVISLLLTLFARRGLGMEISISADQISKGEEIILAITVTKKTFIPAPFIDLVLQTPPGFDETGFDTCRIAMSINKSTDIRIPLTGRICGRSRVGLHRAAISDYLSIFRFNVEAAEGIVCPIDIIPDVSTEIDCADILNAVSSAVLFSEENEESRSSYTTNASPGYEHREYIPGDPLKRVNWKLSSKRGALMIRLDETPSIVRPVIVFDYASVSDGSERENLLAFQRGCEALLALANLCAAKSISCTVFFSDGSQSRSHICDTHDSVKRLALLFGAVNAADLAGSKRCILYDEVIGACRISKNTVIFTDSNGGETDEAISRLENEDVSVVPVYSSPRNGIHGFFIDKDGNIRRN